MSTNTYPVLFSSTLLSAINNTIYTVPASPISIILQDLQLKITNTSTATRTVTLYAVPDGANVDVSTAIVVDMAIPPKDYLILPAERLGAGGSIQGFADVASVISVQPIGGKLHTP